MSTLLALLEQTTRNSINILFGVQSLYILYDGMMALSVALCILCFINIMVLPYPYV